jgi:predicted PurR-regulated permease PerM
VSDNLAPATGGTASDSPMPVPPLLRDLAGWAWRLLVLAAAAYLFVKLTDLLYLIVLPFFAALFATSLTYPLVRFLRGLGLRRSFATLITVLLAGIVLAGVSVFVVDRAVTEYPQLVTQVSAAVTNFRHFLTVDLHVKSSSTASVGNTITTYLNKHESSVAAGAVSGIATVAEVLAGGVLWLFMTFFLLYDGDHIWAWVVGLFPARARERVVGAGVVAWDRLAGFVRGTFIIALIHAVVAAVALSILRVPLVAPLTLLVFVGSFLPIVGSIIFGALAVAITFVTQGWVPGVILTGILVVDNQVEAHLLQPLLVGRYVRLHPLAVAVSIAGGGLLEGIPGAVLAVPIVAVVYAVLKFLATGNAETAAGPLLTEEEKSEAEAADHDDGADESEAAPVPPPDAAAVPPVPPPDAAAKPASS